MLNSLKSVNYVKSDENFLISMIENDKKGQRKIKNYVIKYIVDNFDYKLLEQITLNKRADGTYHVIDGQHRLTACILLGLTTISVRIIDQGLTEEQESELFIALDKNKKKLSCIDGFASSIRANNPKDKQILGVVNKYGYYIPNSNQRRSSHKGISAVKTLRKIVDNYGFNTLDGTLLTISGIWGDNTDSLHYQFLEAMAKFLNRSSKSNNFNYNTMFGKFVGTNPKIIRLQAQNNVSFNVVDSIVLSLINIYNKKTSNKNKLAI